MVGMVGLLFSACADGDNVIDQIVEAEERGIALRTISVTETISINSATNTLLDGEVFEVTLEHQDKEGGALLQEVRVYLAFEDNTDDDLGNDETDDDDENDVDEILIRTIPASDFATGPNGLPRFDYSITADEMTTLLGLSDSDIGLDGDQFVHRFATFLTDGRSFSEADNSGTLTGSFFSSPFQYDATVICAPSIPTAGDWIFDLQDANGDGWDDAFITVTIDGEETKVEIEDGLEEQQVTVNVPVGSEVISIIFESGDSDEEITFQVTSANGIQVLDEGINPTAESELLDYCPNNL